MTPNGPNEQVQAYRAALPPRIRSYLNNRSISDEVIDLHQLGWNGERITIPIFDRDGKFAYFKLAKDPDADHQEAKMLLPPGATVELYGWERVLAKPCRIIICEGEFDRLALETKGFAAVTSTGGAGTFRAEWASDFEPIPEVLVCFDRDQAGRDGARRVASLIPKAKIVELPQEVSEGGDITDYFARLNKTREDFVQLIEQAAPLPPEPLSTSYPQTLRTAESDDDLNCLKAEVAIEDLVGRYTVLRKTGKKFVGLCPLHEDRRPSFFVYTPTHFHCYGCGAHGDVFEFLQRKESLTFPEAVDVLKRFAGR